MCNLRKVCTDKHGDSREENMAVDLLTSSRFLAYFEQSVEHLFLVFSPWTVRKCMSSIFYRKLIRLTIVGFTVAKLVCRLLLFFKAKARLTRKRHRKCWLCSTTWRRGLNSSDVVPSFKLSRYLLATSLKRRRRKRDFAVLWEFGGVIVYDAAKNHSFLCTHCTEPS